MNGGDQLDAFAVGRRRECRIRGGPIIIAGSARDEDQR
jgi:hypothetical protein